MSERKSAPKPKVVRVKKEAVSVEVPRSEPIDIPQPAPKKRKSRAKQPPTKEEAMKALKDASNELKQIVVDLKEDETKLSRLTLKQLPALLKEYKELLALPAETPSE